MAKRGKTKFIFLIILLGWLSLVISGPVLAQRPLEVIYPGKEAPVTVKTSLEKYVKYLFNFSIGIAGLVAFGALVYGGFRYLTSAGNLAAITDAKDQIFSAFLGLIILLCSYLILVTINPELPILKVTKAPLCNCEKPKSEWPWKPGTKEYQACEKYCKELANPFQNVGVYLLKEGYKEGEKCIPDVEKSNCLRILGSISDLGNYGFNDNAKQIKFSNPETSNSELGAILHEDKDFQGQCRIFFEKAGEEFQKIPGKDNRGTISKPSSATVFVKRKKGTEGGYVMICPDPDFTEESKCQKYNNEEIEAGDFPKNVPGSLDNNVRSIKIEGKYIVVLFENPTGSGFPGKCEVFSASDSDLKDNPIGRCGVWEKKWGVIPWYSFKSCVSAIAIYSGR